MVMVFVFANAAVNWCYFVCMFEKTTHRWLAVFSLWRGEMCNVASSRIYGHLLFFACPFRKGQADQLSPFSPCMSQVLRCCRLGFSALNMFLLHPGLMMQEFFENGNCLDCVQEDDSPRCRVRTVSSTDSYPEDCLAYGLDIPGKLLCTGKASH